MSQKLQGTNPHEDKEIQLEQQVREQVSELQDRQKAQASKQITEIIKQGKAEEGHSQNENIQKMQTSVNSEVERVRIFLTANQIPLPEAQASALADYLCAQNLSISMTTFEQWKQFRNKLQKPSEPETQKENKSIDLQNKKRIENIQENVYSIEASQVKKEQSSSQYLNQFFSNKTNQDIKEIKPKIIAAANEIVPSKLGIRATTISNYLKNGHQVHSLELFYTWLAKYQEDEIEVLGQYVKQSQAMKQIVKKSKSIQDLLEIVTQTGSLLKASYGLGQGKGKSILKFGMGLIQTPKERFSIVMEVKTKKKSQLKHFLKNNLKNLETLPQDSIMKLFKYSIQQTERSLKITLSSIVLERFLFDKLIQKIENICSPEQKMCFKVDIELAFKNSIRSESSMFQNKKIVKWMAEGLMATIKIEGNSKVVQHMTQPISEFLPIFKVIRSGEVSLKMKHAQNIQKLFDKLGVNELSQETPSLQEFIEGMIREYLSEGGSLCIGGLLKDVFVFAGSMPNQRIICDVNLNISHLNMNLDISVDSCKQLAEMIGRKLDETSS